jgi:hypothetical protein
MVGYCYGIEKATSESVRGYGVNFLKKLKTVDIPTVRCKDCAGKGCGHCNLSGRVDKDPPQLFVRNWVTIGPDDLDRFVLNRISLAKDILAEREVFKSSPEEAYPMNEGACFKYGEGNECPFLELCWTGNPVQWYAPSEAQLANFTLKEPREDTHEV